MKCIIPLAGPDFYHPEQGAKALALVNGRPLVSTVLESRPWVQSGLLQHADLIFVLRAGPQLGVVSEYLSDTFAGSSQVVLSTATPGALISSLAGISLLGRFDHSLVIDLVDLLYRCDLDVTERFASETSLAGAIPYFPSRLPQYSYLQLGGERVLQTREKEVISENASAGTYFFRDAATFLMAVATTLERVRTGTAWPRPYFLCPSFNALIDAGRKVIGVPVTEVTALKWPVPNKEFGR